jgi:hypothetical protein
VYSGETANGSLHIKSKREVWFATMEQVASYVNQTGS